MDRNGDFRRNRFVGSVLQQVVPADCGVQGRTFDQVDICIRLSFSSSDCRLIPRVRATRDLLF